MSSSNRNWQEVNFVELKLCSCIPSIKPFFLVVASCFPCVCGQNSQSKHINMMLTALSLKILSLVQTETAGKLQTVFEISLWSYIHSHKPAFIFSRTDAVDADFNLFILTQWWPQTMCYDQMVSFSFIYLLIILTRDRYFNIFWKRQDDTLEFVWYDLPIKPRETPIGIENLRMPNNFGLIYFTPKKMKKRDLIAG